MKNFEELRKDLLEYVGNHIRPEFKNMKDFKIDCDSAGLRGFMVKASWKDGLIMSNGQEHTNYSIVIDRRGKRMSLSPIFDSSIQHIHAGIETIVELHKTFNKIP